MYGDRVGLRKKRFTEKVKSGNEKKTLELEPERSGIRKTTIRDKNVDKGSHKRKTDIGATNQSKTNRWTESLRPATEKKRRGEVRSITTKGQCRGGVPTLGKMEDLLVP